MDISGSQQNQPPPAPSHAGRSLPLDLLKLVCALLVIAIHANPFQPLGRTANLLSAEGLSRVAVPVFLVISGYFFYGAARQGRVLAWLRRVLVLYLLWMVIYLPVSWPWFAIQRPAGLLRELVLGYWHLWYLSGLALAGALLGLMRHWPDRVLVAVMALTWAAGIAITWAIAWERLPPGLSPHLHRNGLLLGLPMLLAGWLIRRHGLTGWLAARITLPQMVGLVALALAMMLAESLLLARLAPRGVSHDNLVTLILAAPLLVMLALRLPADNGAGWVGRLDPGLWSAGLYFTHILPCALLFRYTTQGHPAVFVLTLALSLLLTWALIRSGLARRLL